MGDHYIYNEAQALVKKYDTRDPFEIARQLGIGIYSCGNFVDLKGMYKVLLRNRFIFINDKLDKKQQDIICAHELGHDRLHRDLAANVALQEFVLYDMKTRPEYEANLFAASLLLADDDILACAHDGCDVVQSAQILGTDINLVLIKMAEMNQRGYCFNTPYPADSHFLG